MSAGDKKKINQLSSDISGAVNDVLIGNGGIIDTKIANSKSEAVTESNSYADNLNTEMNTRVEILEKSSSVKYKKITQAEYDKLNNPIDDIIYFITD